jgi:hypothetical protein
MTARNGLSAFFIVSNPALLETKVSQNKAASEQQADSALQAIFQVFVESDLIPLSPDINRVRHPTNASGVRIEAQRIETESLLAAKVPSWMRASAVVTASPQTLATLIGPCLNAKDTAMANATKIARTIVF